MKKMMTYLLLFLLIGLTVFKYAQAEELITVEALMEICKIDRNEIPYSDEDIEAVIQKYGITREQLQDVPKETVIMDIIDEINKIKYDYSYLFESETISADTLKKNEIKKVAITTTTEILHPSLILDFDKMLYYYDGGRILFDCVNKAEKQGEIIQNDYQKIQTILNKIEWPAPNGNKENASWRVAIETEKGVAIYNGNGLDYEAGSKLLDIVYELYSLFWEDVVS